MSERPEPSYAGDQPFLFVSYGHADSDLVFPEMRWLRQAGFNLWYDEGIQLGSVWRKAIADALSAGAGMVFFATKTSVVSDHCLKELSFALDEGKPVFVVQLDDTRLPGVLRLSLADRQMLRRASFDEATYRAKLTQALSAVAKPAPQPRLEATKPERVVTTVPSIGLQVLAAGDEETTFWGESVIDDLAMMLGDRPFGITTTHDATKDLAALGRSLDVGYVVSGAVRRADDRYRVNLKLTKGATGAQVWGARYDEQGESIDVADAICRAAVIDISQAVVDEERLRVRGVDPQRMNAWELCVRGASMRMNTLRERDALIDTLRQAAALDSQFPISQAMLSFWLFMSVVTLFSRDPDSDIAEALRNADRALSIAPTNPLVMSWVSMPHRAFGNEALALDLARRANAAAGGDSLFGARFRGEGLCYCLIQAGREEEAIELMLASRPMPERMLYTAYAALGCWEEALLWSQRGAATYPTYFLAWTELANALASQGRLDEAQDAVRRVIAMVPTFTLAYYEKGMRLSWRNREKIVESQLAGLRRLEFP